MGAAFNKKVFTSLSPESAILGAEVTIKAAKYSFGHAGYSGTFAEANGVAIAKPDTPITTEAEAEEWLINNARKWGPALLVALPNDQWVMGAWCSE